MTRKAQTLRTTGEPGSPPSAPIMVGIGASAGGLAALESFFAATPPDCGAAFIVVVHLPSNQKSVLAELLQRVTTMPVSLLATEVTAAANHVYVAPPGKLVSVEQRVLRTVSSTDSIAHRLPIDAFFRSLAADQGQNAVAVVLSGTGSDGTLGIRAIKTEGGIVIAQDKSAKYSGMPHSVAGTGLADFVLPPVEMPACLLRYARQASVLAEMPTRGLDAVPLETLQKVLLLLRARTGHDFSQYKTNTLLRRIQRRMALHQLYSLGDYFRYLRDTHGESTLLFRELLIGVTGFFRDPDAFVALAAAVEQRIDAGRENWPIRVWVPGCSTGEEAYSTAIILHECIEAAERHLPLQIFATDIDEHAIDAARTGIYPSGVRSDVSAERLKRWFKPEEDGRLRVNKTIRESLVFARQNVISDPPFSKLDLICCRNLLIYFSTELQRQVLALFHYSLKPDGLLFLGSSESIGGAVGSFHAIDRKWKLFGRLPKDLPRPSLQLAQRGTNGDRMPDSDAFVAKRKQDAKLVQLLQAVLRETHTPPCAVVDRALNVVFVHGRTGRFLEPAEGVGNVNILEMARPGLREELGICLRKAARERVEVQRMNVQIDENGGGGQVALIAKPLSQPKGLSNLTLVIFDEPSDSTHQDLTGASGQHVPPPPGTLEDLQQLLARARENHQMSVEELETSNEELQSTNEELQSTNEELQSANEELGTSKEELQSLNEEAATVNAELQGRIDQLSRANDDLKNLLDSTAIATVFVDTALNIRRYTPASTALIPLTPGDLGRPISHFATELESVDLGAVTAAMLDDLVVQEREVETKDGRSYLLRVRPYRTSQNVIDGAVLTFEDRTLEVRARRVMERHLADSTRELDETKDRLETSEAKGAGEPSEGS